MAAGGPRCASGQEPRFRSTQLVHHFGNGGRGSARLLDFEEMSGYLLSSSINRGLKRSVALAAQMRQPASRSLHGRVMKADSDGRTAVAATTQVKVDEYGIPTTPAYSLRAFLDALPTPELSDEQFVHLHRLCALEPPPVGSRDFVEQKGRLRQMIRLVEGVRESHKDSIDGSPQHHRADHGSGPDIPDGRIWPENTGTDLEWGRDTQQILQANNADGRRLLDLAAEKHLAGYYSVPRRQKGEVE